MTKNRKGFMLVEVIVTSTVIVTSMILLYSSYQHLFTKYKANNTYHNVDALYSSKAMFNYLFNERSWRLDFNSFINEVFYNHEFYYLIKNGNCSNDDITQSLGSFCDILKSTYKVENMIITSYDENNIKSILGDTNQERNITQTMKEYLDYIIGYYNITSSNVTTDDNPYSYIIITEIKDNDKYYYENLPIR